MSNLAICKIGVGPSSSHTLGPLVAGNRFCELVRDKLASISRICITLYGSLSLTGRGHLSDKAVLWGLEDLRASSLTKAMQAATITRAFDEHILLLCGKKAISFHYEKDIIFSKEFLPLHENALQIIALNTQGDIIESSVFYSIGGGFVKSDQELISATQDIYDPHIWQIENATKALYICDERGYTLASLSREYERQFHSDEAINRYCLEIWECMQDAYYQGIHPTQDYLPGKLHLKRRAKGLFERLNTAHTSTTPLASTSPTQATSSQALTSPTSSIAISAPYTHDPMEIIDSISLYAIAIAEENASGARVVTAPTNGACAVIPAVMLYRKHHTQGFTQEKIIDFLLTAMLIGSFYKKNASISGAEAGCQAEIGSASSMAAGALATTLGADARQSCSAAEMAMEHHLGLTCDPVGGLVQIPCIERNAFGAIKAISAARMAMARKSTPIVSLDEVIKTMYQTGKDMNAKYRETSLGGLAKTLSSVC